MKKIYTLLTALLVAGSMMATIESVDFSQQGYTNQQYVESYGGEKWYVIFDYNTSGYSITPAKYYDSGESVRVYSGSNLTLFTAEDTLKFTRIEIVYGSGDGTNGNDNPLTPSIGQFDGSVWTGNASKVKFTVGAKSNGATGGHRRIHSLIVTYHVDKSESSSIDPSVNIAAYLGPGISTLGSFVRNPEVYGEWMLIYPRKFTADYGVLVHIGNPEDVFGCTETLPGCYELTYYPAPNEYCYIEEGGWHNIYFRPNRDGGDGWCRGCIKIEHLPQAPDPTNFFEAALFVGQEDENAVYNNGKTYTLEGYVKEIKEAYQDKYHNISFWLSDKANDTYKDVLAFRAACPKASHAVQVGDKVRITGSLMRYNSYYVEFTQGCTYEILNREEEQGVEETELPDSAVKSLENGQLRIERNGIRYNAFGQVVR
jgi:hypothetical protein